MANLESLRQLEVQLLSACYPIILGSNCLSNTALLHRYVKGSQVLIVTNETIAPLYLNQVQVAFSHIQADVLILKDGETHKNQTSLSTIYDALIEHHHHRDTTLIALGGGVIGDLVGFAASTYQRGVPFIQIPTSLLAQVDASVGGKTAINYSHAKNVLGSFYQPQAVVIDVSTLKTLPLREFRAGLAEVIKYAILVGGDFSSLVAQALSTGIHPDDAETLTDLIERCCRIKAAFVEKDERELGQRALLNLGHTFAHALESSTYYERWLHGEAVAIGLYCAALLSHTLGYLRKTELEKIDKLLKSAYLPHRIPADLDLDTLQSLMRNDKKIKNNQLRFVLVKAFGDCGLENQVSADCLRQVLLSAVEGER